MSEWGVEGEELASKAGTKAMKNSEKRAWERKSVTILVTYQIDGNQHQNLN